MAKAEGIVPNLINGISQQSPAARLNSQANECENFQPSIVKGLTKRPPSEFLADLGIVLPAGSFTHFILRDTTEKYVMAILPTGTIRVWDFTGDEKTVNVTVADGYLAGLTMPEDELRALTIADHTFVVNKSRTVAHGTARSPTRPYEALVGVLSGNYGKTYRIKINGVITGEFTTPNGDNATHAPIIDTVNIANELFNDFVANHYDASPWAVGRYHSTVYVRNTSFDFTIATEDGYAGRAMKDNKKRVQKFTDLPSHGPADVVMEVVGDENTGFDNYWVRFDKENDANSSGVWKECPAPNTLLGLDNATMPHILVREADGSFSFKPAEWEDRKCGDADTVPDPSFVGQTIEDVFFHRNRLGFLTKENIVMSESGKFYNFFRTTLTALLDTDPIDVAANHVKVSLLRHAVPYSDLLILFSDQTQFRFQGNELLTPKTVNARPLSELNAHPRIRPVAVGSSCYFLTEREGWAALIEYYIDKSVENADTDDVSAHAPTYIPAGVHRLVASPDLDMAYVLTTGDPGAIYGYKFFWNGQEKVQSAWFRWTLPGVDKVLNVEFDKGSLLALVTRGGKVQLEKINCEIGLTDEGVKYKVHLDRRISLTGGTYNAGTGKTTYALPYAPDTGYLAVTASGGPTVPGVVLPFSVAGSSIVVEGDHHLQPIKFGRPYSSEYEFSEFFLRDQEGRTSDQDGRLQVLHMALSYSQAASFRVIVECEGRPPRTYTFTGRIVSDPDNLLGQIALDSGRLSFPVFSRSDRVKIRIINDSWLPSNFSAAKWHGTWNPLSRQQ
jgi:hypothetical protein